MFRVVAFKEWEIDKAITAFRKAIELMPDSYNAHLCLGNVYVQKGEIKNAITEYGKVLEILSKKFRMICLRG